MTKTEQHSIHPDPSGPTKAESPYTRKLKRVREDLEMVLQMAPANQKEDVAALIMSFDMLIAGI